MNVLSLFDGMSCGQIALERSGICVDNYFASEIDKYAMKVTKSNYPDTQHIGSVVDIKGENLPKIDLLIGGSPCQGFSSAGKGLNFDDPRSALFFEFIRLLKETKPKYFLLENVRMKKDHQEVISKLLGVEPICINSSLLSAQNRVRLYWTNIPDVGQPSDSGITWGDIREHGVNEFYYTEKALQWLGRHSQRKSKTLDIWGDNEKAQMLEASDFKNYSSQRFFGVCDIPKDKEAIASMRGRRINPETLSRDDYNKNITPEQYVEFRYDGKSNCLSTVAKDNIVVPFTLPNRIPLNLFFFRYKTPTECERLQTVPDGYTDFVSNPQRYKMLGNGWTVDVIAHIFNGMNGFDLARG